MGPCLAEHRLYAFTREGKEGRSIDPIFINALLKALNPNWIRPPKGSNIIAVRGCGGRSELIRMVPIELKRCEEAGGNTTLMVWADLDHDMKDGNQLREAIWKIAKSLGVTQDQFDKVVFAFAKDRLENWIEFLLDGATDETREGPRRNNGSDVKKTARKLADICFSGSPVPGLPPSLVWSCKNWQALRERMKKS